MLVLLLYSLILTITYNIWIFNNGIFTHGDWFYFHKETLLTSRLDYFHIWLSDFGLGRVVLDLGQAPTYALYGILAKLFNVDFTIALKIIHIIPIIIFPSLFSYIFIKSLVKNRLSAAIGSLVFSFNTYTLTLQTGHLTLMVAISIVPLVLYVFHKIIEKFTIARLFCLTILLALVGFYEPRILYLSVGVITLLTIFELFTSKFEWNKLKIFAFIPLLGMLNSFWILGFVKTGSLATNELFSRELFGNEFLNILYAITLYHPFWSGSQITAFEINKIPLHQWLLPLSVVIGLILNYKNKTVLAYFCIALAGILLAKQVGFPFQWLYPTLYNYFPGFSAFREASKFFFLISIGYSVLIGFFVRALLHDKRLPQVIKSLIVLLVSVLLLWNVRPIVTGEIGTLFQVREIPQDYISVKNHIVDQDEYFRTLWVPTFSRWGVFTHNHPELSAVLLINSDWKNFIHTNKDDLVTEAEQTIELFSQKYSDQLMDISSIKYVYVPLQDVENDDNFFVYYGNKERQYYLNELDKLKYLKRTNIGSDEIVVYENKNYRPHIYITTEKETIYQNIQHSSVNYSYINPTKYSVSLKNVKKPIYLNFSEGYHPDWNLRIGDFNWKQSLFKTNYFLDNKYHYQNNAQLNSYHIDPDFVCKSFKCMKNSDGSYEINMTLYFRPQSYVYIGGIVSIATLSGMLIYLCYCGVKKLRSQYKNLT